MEGGIDEPNGPKAEQVSHYVVNIKGKVQFFSYCILAIPEVLLFPVYLPFVFFYFKYFSLYHTLLTFQSTSLSLLCLTSQLPCKLHHFLHFKHGKPLGKASSLNTETHGFLIF